jgi:two-component system sensor histidine kinase KdpD
MIAWRRAGNMTWLLPDVLARPSIHVMARVGVRSLLRLLAVALPSLAGATVLVAILQDDLGVPNPSAVYIVAVVAAAVVSGTYGALATAVASFVLYNFLFTEPRYTLSMHEPGVWLSVVLLLFVGVVVGQMTALLRARAEVAGQREREARALFSVSRTLAARESLDAVLPAIARALETEADMAHVAVTIGAAEPAATDAATRASPAQAAVINQLRRAPDEGSFEWVRVHQPAARVRARAAEQPDEQVFRVPIIAAGDAIGAIWATRPRAAAPPDPEQTRLLGAAADQLGQAVAHDRMAADTRAAAIARESDALKSALLQSVSHDLRTPLATIRAAAGTLRGHTDSPVARESVDAIEREVEYLNRLVSNLLDLSRIEAGVLRAQVETFELEDLVRAALVRLADRLAGWQVEDRVSRELVAVDPVFFDAALTNVLENVTRHTEPGTRIVIATQVSGERRVVLRIEDSGSGVPDGALERLFDKFYRVPGRHAARAGTGIGLAVTRGLIEAMGGQVTARRSPLGGLAIDFELDTADVPAELATATP